MHDHIKIIGGILILILGISISFYVQNLKHKYRDYTLKWLLYYIIAYNLAIFLVLTRKYIDVNLTALIKIDFPFSILVPNIEMLFNIFRLASIIIVIGFLINKDFSHIVKKYLLAVELFAIIMIFLKYSNYHNSNIAENVDEIFFYLAQIIFYIEALALLILLFYNSMSETSKLKTLIKYFAILFLTRYIFFLLFYVIPINILGYFDRYLQATLILSSITFFNVMPFVWLKLFYEKYYSVSEIISSDNIQEKLSKKENRFDEMGITERENEVINLIIQGKKNKEIEELLFLSSHTVKNHIYNVYKKLGINSRFQLIQLYSKQDAHLL